MQGLAPLDLKSASVPIMCCAIGHRTFDATIDFSTLLSQCIRREAVVGRMRAARGVAGGHGALDVGWRDMLLGDRRSQDIYSTVFSLT